MRRQRAPMVLLALLLALTFAACATNISVDPVATDEMLYELDALRTERDELADELERVQAELETVREAKESAARETEEVPVVTEECDGYDECGGEEYDDPIVEHTPPVETAPPADTNPPAMPQTPAAQITTPAATTVPPAPQTGTVAGTGFFAGVNVTVTNQTTVATSAAFLGRDFTRYYFLCANGNRLGSITGDAYWQMVERDSSLAAQGGPERFASEFNRHRGIGGGTGAGGDISGEQATATATANQENERQELIRLINAEREIVGSAQLAICPYLTEFAQIRANEGGSAGGAPHTRPDGTRVGNELWASGRTAQGVFNQWMNSEGHRAAMLGTGTWDHIRTFGVAFGSTGAVIILDTIAEFPPA